VSDPVRPLDDLDIAGTRGSSPPASAATETSRFKRPRGRAPFPPAREASPTRQRILEVARDLFCSRGYERTPLRAISDSLGVTKAALYYYFRAKDDLLSAIVGPTLDRIDEMLAAADPAAPERARQRAFLVAYVEELVDHADIVALLIRDHGVGEHPLGRRFASQRVRMRELLGTGDGPASVIRTTTALRALELAVIEFAGADPALVRDTALKMAVAVLDS
jgi:AcrR family transcriptional regulator